MNAAVEAPATDVDVLIVGSGFGGPGMGLALLKAPRRSFAVLERARDVGGTWRDNTYPGCACDVPSALYSYSFAPKPDWTRAFAGQPEIRRYLNEVADRFGVRHQLHLGVEVLRAQWHEPSQR